MIVWAVLAARTLGPAVFGAIAVTLATSSLVASMSTLGVPMCLSSGRGHDVEIDSAWRQSMGALLLGLPVVAVPASALIAATTYGLVPLHLLLLIALAEILLGSLAVAASYLLHRRRDLGWAGFMQAGNALARVAAIAIFATSETREPSDYAVAHAASALIWIFVCLWSTCRIFGTRCAIDLPSRQTLRTSIPFALGAATASASNEIDKPIVSWFGGIATAGQYAIAYRLAGAMVAPVTAFSSVAYPRLAAAAASGNWMGVRRMVLLGLSAVMTYAVCAGAAFWAASPTLAALLGSDYSIIGNLGLTLAALLILLALRQFIGLCLLAIGRPAEKAAADLVAVLCLGFAFLSGMIKYDVSSALLAASASEFAGGLLAGVLLAGTMRRHALVARTPTSGEQWPK